ncbi:hypothetical protein GCM10010353_65500 [Streptomyces chryseus]|nr:hypothetical protein GCM10010353_65500 [Streptomyces chryseus]
MIEAAICDGDIVTVRQADSADHGDTVAAMLDGRPPSSACARERRVGLMPHNPAYEPRRVAAPTSGQPDHTVEKAALPLRDTAPHHALSPTARVRTAGRLRGARWVRD